MYIGNPATLAPYRLGSLVIDDVINARTVVQGAFRHAVTKHYEEGEPVTIDNDQGTRLFQGFIDEVDEEHIPGSLEMWSHLRLKDNHYLVGKRTIGKVYENMAAGAIVSDILAEKLAAEGITAGTIQDGPTIIQEIFNHVYCDQALDKLKERTGYIWYVDEQRRLNFHARSTFTAPWGQVRLSDARIRSFRYRKGHGTYRNRQLIRSARDRTTLVTETRPGDGSRSYAMGYPLISEPTIKVNGAEQSVGIKGVDDGNFAWYWNEGDTVVTQDDDETALTSADTLEVQYYGEFRIVAYREDTAEQAARIAREGVGSGINENVYDDAGQTSGEAAHAEALELLNVHKTKPATVTFQTRVKVFAPGQILTVDVSEHNLVMREFLVTAVKISEKGKIPWFHITAVDGPEGKNWTDFYKQREHQAAQSSLMAQSGSQDVLVRGFSYSKTWALGESPRPFEEPTAGGGHLPGEILAAFQEGNQVRYLAWESAPGVELGRKANAQFRMRRSATPPNFFSVALISPGEYAGPIAYLAWYGGQGASAVAGSGVLIDRQAVSITKSAAEAIQIDRTDYKGY